MAEVVLLDQETANRIAAGEVIERPYSVVKELIENSIDAQADLLEIEVKGGGLDFIRVVDNGTGMSQKNALTALCRHATSKIRGAGDLKLVKTLGFRGEALPSIASVSHLRLRTRRAGDLAGTEMMAEGGNIVKCLQKGCPKGTEVLVRNLFYNTPARRKFLKSTASEVSKISDIVNRLALSFPGISFSLVCEGRHLLKTWGRGSLLEVISMVYGRDKVRHYIPVVYNNGSYAVSGYIAKPILSRSNRSYQSFFINGRFIRSSLLSRSLEDAYGTLLSRNTYPMAVLNLEVEPQKIDINVHPAKIEVRFAEEKVLYQVINDSVRAALKKQNLVPEYQGTGNINRKKLFKQSSFYSDVSSKAGDILPDSAGRRDEDVISDGVLREEKRTGGTQFISTAEEGGESVLKEESGAAQGQVRPSEETAAGAAQIEKTGVLTDENYAVGEKDGHIYVEQAEQNYSADRQKRETSNFIAESAWSIKNTVFKILNQFLGTYILIQRGRDLLLIDQHAAHERVIYDRLKEEVTQSIISQEIIPQILELTSGTEMLAEENRHFWEELGFKIEPFGNNSYILRSVPLVMKDIYSLDLLEDIIHSYPGQATNLEVARDDVLKVIACKAAFKANQKLPAEEMEMLVKQLFETKEPYTCPHGRPTMIVITESDLEKNFKRRS